MSVRFESANSEYATKTSYIADGNIIQTVGLWFYLYSLPATAAPLFTFYASFAGYSIEVDSGGHLQIHDYNSDARTAGSTVLSTTTWYYVWARKVATGGTTIFCYLDGATSAEVSAANSCAAADTTVQFASSQAGYGTDYWADCALVNAKFWNVDVAASQANTEKASFTVTNTTGNLSAWQLDVYTDLTDNVGAKNLTATGTLSNGATNPFGGATQWGPQLSRSWNRIVVNND